MRNVFFALGTIIVLIFGISVLPIDKINWGRVSVLPAATITVTGTSESQVANQVASFGATVSEVNANKDTAVNAVNTKMTALINSLKDFGIPEADIQTQSVSVYQIPEDNVRTLIYPAPVPPQQTGSGDWQASNSISLTLRDVAKASALTDILNKSGATNVYGPNLTVDTKAVNDSELLAKAVQDAKTKAENMAKAGGRSLGKMLNVTENGGIYPMPLYATKDSASSVASPIEPGTSTLTKSVTVVFELK